MKGLSKCNNAQNIIGGVIELLRDTESHRFVPYAVNAIHANLQSWIIA